MFVVGLVGLLALGAAGFDVVARSADLVITDMSLTALGSADHPETPVVVPGQVDGAPVQVTTTQNILLVGTDSREGLTDEQRNLMHAGDHGGELTDTMVWVQYLPSTRELRMVSFPRDIAVQTPTRGREKLNALQPIYGPNALVKEIEAMVGEDLDHYVEIDLAGFLSLTEAIGGVEVCLEEPLDDPVVGYLPSGCHVLDAIDASKFVRARKSSDGFGGGTFGRAARQQYFLRQAMDKVLTAGTLTDPAALRALVTVASRSLVVDDGLTLGQMYDLANVFRSIDPSDIEGVSVPVDAFIGSDGGYYERLDERSELLFQALRLGAPLPSFEEDDDGSDVQLSDHRMRQLLGEGFEEATVDVPNPNRESEFAVEDESDSGPDGDDGSEEPSESDGDGSSDSGSDGDGSEDQTPSDESSPTGDSSESVAG